MQFECGPERFGEFLVRVGFAQNSLESVTLRLRDDRIVRITAGDNADDGRINSSQIGEYRHPARAVFYRYIETAAIQYFISWT